MSEPIDILENRLLSSKPEVLTTLLADRTTRQNIFWACQSYASLGGGYGFSDPITVEAITGAHGNVIRPRAVKAREEQQQRSREMAEVFTPSWLCNEMNNEADAQWFGRADVFNTVGPGHQWQPQPGNIVLPEGKTWQDYALTTRLEITCGEAPFLVSRYDTVTGETIPLARRIGLLDRKLRVVSEQAAGEAEWSRWALLALGSCYGYEWQGDSLLLAREAVVETFAEYYEQRFGKPVGDGLLAMAAEIVSWNLWQMDGLKGVVPCSCREVKVVEPNFFGEPKVKVTPCPGCATGDSSRHNGLYCQLRRWLPSAGTMPDGFTFSFPDIITKKYKTYHKTKWLMKFDFIIGNPPYQEEKEDNGRQPPIYDKFMDGVYKLSDKVVLVSPARFLFNAGQTSKEWNRKMLNDPHLKVLYYEQDSSKVFPGTDIKGGVSITYHDNKIDFGAIGVFTSYDELNSILHKVKDRMDKSLADIIYAPTKFDLDHLYEKHPEYKPLIKSDGKDKLLRTNIFERLEIFHEVKEIDDDVAIIGVISNKRHWRYVNRFFLDDSNGQIDKWKVLIAKSNGSGALGEILSSPFVAKPSNGYTQSFFGIGAFYQESEAKAVLKYIKGKFARTMLGVLKITQDNPPEKWKYVPLQDFTSSSDIDWTKSVHEIDLQLYDKYGLTEAERDFIETHVKAME